MRDRALLAVTAALLSLAACDRTIVLGALVQPSGTDGGPHLAEGDQRTASAVLAFSLAHSYPAGAGPSAVVAADLDGDGRQDLAVASHDAGTASVLLGLGQGAFRLAGSFAAGPAPAGLAAADFNWDGKADLAVADQGGGVSVLLGSGGGSFGAAHNYPAGTGPVAVVVADFLRIGRADLAVASATSKELSVLRNQVPAGGQLDANSFSSRQYALQASPAALVVGDLDGDFTPDLVAVGADIEVLLGQGDGTLGAPLTAGTFSPLGAAVLADLSGHGRPDLATTGLNEVVLYYNNGAGTLLNEKFTMRYAVGQGPSAIAAADFNGDGKIDLVTANAGDGTLSVLLGAGDGTFAPAQAFPAGPAGNVPAALAVADLDGDHRPDLAVADRAMGQVHVILNTSR